MQKYPDNLSENDRRIARRWTLASIGFYGSILAGFILYAAFGHGPGPGATLASVDASKATASRAVPGDTFARMPPRRMCDQKPC